MFVQENVVMWAHVRAWVYEGQRGERQIETEEEKCEKREKVKENNKYMYAFS